MSTRCNITIQHGDTRIRLYRHCDGYLAETGFDIHEKVRAAHNVDALLVAFLTKRYEQQSHEKAPRPVYELTTEIHGDIEHEYLITTEGYPGKVLTVHHRPVGFDGPARAWTKYERLEDFAAQVNRDRVESNRRLAMLRKKQPGAFGGAQGYTLIPERDHMTTAF